MIKKLIKWFKRNPCKECEFYHSKDNVCQSKKLQLVGVIRMLIGLTDIFANHTSQKVMVKNDYHF